MPKKQADELRALGVQIPLNNILESRDLVVAEQGTERVTFVFIFTKEEDWL